MPVNSHVQTHHEVPGNSFSYSISDSDPGRRVETSPFGTLKFLYSGSSSIGRAPAFQAGGCGFESRLPLFLKLINISSIRVGEVALPLPFVLYDDTTPQEDILKYYHDFFTIYAGTGESPHADYRIPPSEVESFLETLRKKSVREILKDFYDRQRFPENYVFFSDHTRNLFETIRRLLTSPMRPWILLYGAEGTGKISLVKTVLGNRVLYLHELEDRHIGFRRELKKSDIDDVVVKVNLLQSEFQLSEIITFLYHGGYQAIFVLDGERDAIPPSLRNLPAFRVPTFFERSLKEKLLILEHLLRKLNSNANISPSFVETLFYYPWPGNITQLENTLRYILSLSDTLDFQFLPDIVKGYFGNEYNRQVVEESINQMVKRIDYSNLPFELLEAIPHYVGQRLLENILHQANNDFERVFQMLNIKSEEQVNRLRKMFERYFPEEK